MLTGPLPEQVEYLKLMRDQAILQGIIPLHRFSRLRQLLQNDDGNVQARLEFRTAKKRQALVVGQASFDAGLVCQACLLPLMVQIDVVIRLNLVSSDQALLDLRQDEDGMLVEDSLLALVDLIEDELIVNLPMFPRHETGSFEVPVSGREQADTGETHRPFAALSAMQPSPGILKNKSN